MMFLHYSGIYNVNKLTDKITSNWTRIEKIANRFVQYEDDALQELLEGKTSKNTDKATKTSITLLKTFCDQTNLNTDLEQISAMQLDRVLQRCYAGVRKPNGELYKPTTMNSFRFGFQ